MFTTDESGFEVGGRRPACLAGPEAEAKRLAAWKAAWETRIRCCGITRAGVQCKNQPMRGRVTCRRRGPAASSRHPLKKPPTALAMHAREMRRLWRAAPWTDGFTVELDPEGQDRLEAWADGSRHHVGLAVARHAGFRDLGLPECLPEWAASRRERGRKRQPGRANRRHDGKDGIESAVQSHRPPGSLAPACKVQGSPALRSAWLLHG